MDQSSAGGGYRQIFYIKCAPGRIWILLGEPYSPQAPFLHMVSEGVRGTQHSHTVASGGAPPGLPTCPLPACGMPPRALLFGVGHAKHAISLHLIPEIARPRHSLCKQSFVSLCGPMAPGQSNVSAGVSEPPHGPTPQNPASTGFFERLRRLTGEASWPSRLYVSHRLEPRIFQALPPRPGGLLEVPGHPGPAGGSERPCGGCFSLAE